jgi:hypothetical protein
MSNLSALCRWDISGIIDRARPYILGDAMVKVTSLSQLATGKRMRVARNKQIKQWAVEWSNGRGFDPDGNYMRVYCPTAKVPTLRELFEKQIKKYEEAGLKVPPSGPDLGKLDIAALVGILYIIDGQHRTITLAAAHAKWMELQPPGTDENTSPYIWVRVVIYTEEVKSFIAMLGKASNDTKQVHVGEDGLERITLTQQIIGAYEEEEAKKDSAKRKKLTETLVARFMMTQAGRPPGENDSGVKYHCQLVGVALALRGPVTMWLIQHTQELEDLGTTRSQVGLTFIPLSCFILIFVQHRFWKNFLLIPRKRHILYFSCRQEYIRRPTFVRSIFFLTFFSTQPPTPTTHHPHTHTLTTPTPTHPLLVICRLSSIN